MEINKNDIVSFKVKVEDIQTFSDGIKAYKLGNFYVSKDTLNKMNVTSVESFASTDVASVYSPFDRVRLNDEYWFVDTDGEVEGYEDNNDAIDKALHDVANYCTDKKLIKQRAMHEVLNRLLWRYSEEHGGDNEWDNIYPFSNHYYIYFNNSTKEFSCTYNDAHKKAETIYFKSPVIAQNAIKDIIEPFIEKHPDFVW